MVFYNYEIRTDKSNQSGQTSQINPDRQVKSNRTKIDKLKKDRRHIHQDY